MAGQDYEAHRNLSLADRRRSMQEQGQLSTEEALKIRKARARANQSTRNFLRAVDGDNSGIESPHPSGSGGVAMAAGVASPRIVDASEEGAVPVSGLRAASSALKRRNRRASTGGMPGGVAGGRRRRGSVDESVDRRR